MRRAYPEYRDSGVEWLGDVPAHWDVRRLKDAGTLIAGSAFPETYQGVEGEELPFFKVGDLSKSADGRWLSETEHTISRETASEIKARIIPENAIIYAKIGAALLLNRRRIIVKPACIDNNMSAFVPSKAAVLVQWALYALTLLDFRNYVNPGAIPSLSEGDQALLHIPIAPIGEQCAIATFLDRETGRIDKLMEKNRLLMERLAEYRTALITKAVTRGLDSSVKLKPSGVEWLGDVPEHWEVKRLKGAGTLIAGSAFPERHQGVEGEELPFFKVGDLNKSADGRWLSETEHTISRETASEIKARIIPENAIIYAKIGAALLLNRRRIIVKPACIDNNMSAFVPSKAAVSVQWALYALTLLDFRNYVNPGAIPSLSEGDQALLHIPIAPIAEQRAITAFLDDETARIDALISKANSAIERLQEYRAALITAAVTGKIDVREPE